MTVNVAVTLRQNSPAELSWGDLDTNFAALANGVNALGVQAQNNTDGLAQFEADLASSDPAKGAAMVGFTQSGSGTVGRTVRSKLQDMISLNDYVGATVNDKLSSASSNSGGFYVPPGTYSISGSITITVPIILMPGATLSLASGVTVTFASGFSAGLHAVFSYADSTCAVLFTNGAVQEVYPEWWGAKADNLDSSAAANTTAISYAIKCNKKVSFAAGRYIHNGISVTNTSDHLMLEGAGFLKTTLVCKKAATNNITVTATSSFYTYLVVRDLAIEGVTGVGATGVGIYLNGVVWYLLENLYITNNGGHGIQLIDTGTPSNGSFIGTIRNVKSAANAGDGVYQVATSGTNQQNATYITVSELQGNANGATLWGVNLTIHDSIIEGNTGYGVRLQNFKTVGPVYSAQNISIKDNYFEGNPSGHIYVKTNAVTSGVIVGLEILNNFTSQNNGASYVAVKFDSGGNENEIRGLVFRGNGYSYVTAPTVFADFGGCLGYDCIVEPQFNLSTSASDLTLIPSRYISLGYAKLRFISSQTISGYLFAKGGSGITYSTTGNSDTITVSGSNTYFPVLAPLSSDLLKICVPVDTDATAYSIAFDMKSRGYDSSSAYSDLFIATIAGAGSGLITTNVLLAYTSHANMRASLSNLDKLLKITVTLTSPGTYFKLGNPTIFYNA